MRDRAALAPEQKSPRSRSNDVHALQGQFAEGTDAVDPAADDEDVDLVRDRQGALLSWLEPATGPRCAAIAASIEARSSAKG